MMVPSADSIQYECDMRTTSDSILRLCESQGHAIECLSDPPSTVRKSLQVFIERNGCPFVVHQIDFQYHMLRVRAKVVKSSHDSFSSTH